MAIVVDNKSTATASATQISAEHICTGTEVNGILIITIQITDSTLSDRIISSVTHNGEPCTHLGADSDDPTDGLRTEIWYRLNPTTGGAPDIVVTAGGKCTDLSFGAVSLTGVDSSNAPGLIDSYSKDNQNLIYTDSDVGDGHGQSFTGDGKKLSKCELYLRRGTSGDTGTITAYLYAHTGVFGISSKPANGASPLAISTNTVDVSTLSSSTLRLKAFSFDETYTLVAGIKYIIAYKLTAISGSVKCGVDTSSPTHDGNGCVTADDGANWASQNYVDVIFYIYSPEIKTAIGANTDPTLDVTTIGSSSYVVDSLASGEPGGTAKITAVHRVGGSPIHETDVGSDFHGSQFVDAGGAGAQTMNWADTDEDTRWVMSAVAVQIAAEGPANLKTVNTITKTNIKTINSVATGSIKSVNGIT